MLKTRFLRTAAFRVAALVALPACIGTLLLAVAAGDLTAGSPSSVFGAMIALLIACACWTAAALNWRASGRGAARCIGSAAPALAAAGSLTLPASIRPGPADGLMAAPWERDLLAHLPGLSFVVQPVNEGSLTDWLLLAGHGGAPDKDGPARDLAREAAEPPIDTPELLSHWLARHPGIRPSDVVAALQNAAADGAEPATPWRILPLGATHRVLWLAPPASAPAPASALPAPSPAKETDRESIAYTVSHDLRAPIRVIEGFTRIVREDYGHLLDRIGNDHLDRVLGAAARMNSMIDALLALSRLSTQPLGRETTPLSTMAGQIIEELRAQAPTRVLQAVIEPGLVAQGDPALLRSLLDNLLGNAWKYTARRAEARIEFGATRLARLRPAVSAAEDRTVYFVRDNGAGFDMRFAERLFGAFQRLHSASEFAGTGVGLASVRRIVTRHGGEVWAESAVDRGASFYFTLS